MPIDNKYALYERTQLCLDYNLKHCSVNLIITSSLNYQINEVRLILRL